MDWLNGKNRIWAGLTCWKREEKKGQAWLEKDENVVDMTGFKISCYLYTQLQNWDLTPTSIQANWVEI